jgi:imidazolonepropionase-like amidohydrolase
MPRNAPKLARGCPMTNRVVQILGMVLLSGTLAAAAYGQDTILIRNGTVVPVVGKAIPNGSLLIQKGKIAAVGADLKAPAGAQIIDAKGMFVYPGMVAPLTSIGLTGYPGAGNDVNEIGTSTPYLDPYDSLNPEDECVEVTRIDGVTTVLTAAGANSPIDGKAIVLNLEGDLPQDMVMKRDVLVVFNDGNRLSGYPSTLAGLKAFIRDKLNKAREAAQKKEPKEGQEPPKWDPEMQTLGRVLNRELPVMFVTSGETSVRNAIELIDEYNLRGIIFAEAGILKYAEQLGAKKIPVIWAGTTTIPERWEPIDQNYRAASVLAAKGVLFAFNESGGQGSRNVRRQPVPASLSVAYGLSEEEAIKALTINPARILGIDDQVGSLEPGKIANVVVCTKSLTQLSSKIQTVIIKGKVIPLTSYQTRLAEKFGKIVKERMSKQ